MIMTCYTHQSFLNYPGVCFYSMKSKRTKKNYFVLDGIEWRKTYHTAVPLKHICEFIPIETKPSKSCGTLHQLRLSLLS